MAEGLLRQRLAVASVGASVSSAGFLGDGVPATSHAVDTLRRRGLDISGHRSRRLDADLLARADLVVGMAREHVREAAVLDPSALTRTFTLNELVQRGQAAGPRGPGEQLPGWLERIGAGRRPGDLLGPAAEGDLDIADPIGGPAAGYERTAAEIDELLGRLVELVWPARGGSAGDGREPPAEAAPAHGPRAGFSAP